MDRESIIEAINKERERQEQLHPLPQVRSTHDAELLACQKYIQTQELLAVLIEEVGEVGKAMQGDGDLEEELIQVASVCFRWLELKDPSE